MAIRSAADYNAGMSTQETYHHRRLDCGVDFAAVGLEGRGTVCYQIRVLAGLADEPEDRLGVAGVVEETIDKGTERFTGRQLSDAFDALGAQQGSGVGRQSFTFRCSCLPEFAEQALALHAEMLRRPTFPEASCDVAVELALQDLTALEDDPDEMARKLIGPRAFGPKLGRHDLGTAETLRRITREDVVAYWRTCFAAPRMQISVGGAVDRDRFAASVETQFAGFGRAETTGDASDPAGFTPGAVHHQKDLEQEHVILCWPGVAATHVDYPVERVMLKVLGGGMSSRLFTEVREKQGLVYGVGAWAEHPRGTGRLFIGASTRPDRCDQTFKTLLREVERLAEDVCQDELNRVKKGILTKSQTHGDITRARLGDLSSDMFHHGRPITPAERNERIVAVTLDDIRRYLNEHPRAALCVLTLGPRPLNGEAS